jgi:hypothetical protein
MKPLTARTLAASHRSPDDDGRSMRPATIGKENRQRRWLHPHRLGARTGGMAPNAARKTVSLGVPTGFHP